MRVIETTRAETERTIRQDVDCWEPWLVEGLAQTAAVLDGDNRGALAADHKGMLVGVRRFRIERAPLVGETVVFRVDLVKKLGAVTLVDGTARVGDEEIARGELKFYVETGE